MNETVPCQWCGKPIPDSALRVGVPRAYGVSRVFDNDQAVLVSFDRKPTDDELRALHDLLREAALKEPR